MPTPAAKKPTKTPKSEAVKKAAKPAAAKAEKPAPKSTATKKAPKKAKEEVALAAPPPAEVEVLKPAPEKPVRARKTAPAKSAQEADALPTEPAAPKAAPGLSAHAETMLAALREGRPLEFIFLDGDANPPRTFEPRQLIFDTLAQAWFVWGWDRRYNAERHHRVDALAEVNQVEGMGRSAQGPYKEGTAANLLGGWLGGEPIPVRATLMKQWIFAVKQAPPAFPEFKVTDVEDGKATVTFTATDLRAIARWCMQFGDGIQVLEPQRLVDRLKQAGVAWAGKSAAATPLQAQPAPKGGSAAAKHEREPHPGDAAPAGGRREPRREERHREPRSGTESAPSHGASKGGAPEPKPQKVNPKVEFRVERL